MIFGRSIDREDWFGREGKGDAVGVVLLHGATGDTDLTPIQFDPQEARDLAKSLEWAADNAESDLRRIAREEAGDVEGR